MSLGCPKNLVDSEKLLGLLAEAGCVIGAPLKQADVVLVNTCAFIESAREESMQAIREAVRAKKKFRVQRVVVAGCLAQKQADELLKAEPGIDAIVGVFDRDKIVPAVMGKLRSGVTKDHQGCQDDRGRLRLTPRHMAYLRISEGCSSGCSYCTIPSIRGPLRSKPLPDVLEEAKELAADGAIELNLIGQDTSAYGQDLTDRGTAAPGSEGTNLAVLLRKLNEIESVRWIRVMYANPATMTDEMVAAMSECERVVKYLDIPLQHISDKILTRMNRHYNGQRVVDLLARLRRAMPGIIIRTTFIAGFPGEAIADYDQLMEFVKTARFDAVGVFPYSAEPGTPAARLPNQIPIRISQRRRDKLMREQQKVAFDLNWARMDTELDVLVESQPDPDQGEGLGTGRHAGQAPEVDGICHITEPAEVGTIIRARVVDIRDYDLVVEPVQAE